MPASPPAFEVASVKPNDGTGPSGQRTLPNGTLVLTNNTLRNIIRTAFGVQGAQVVGGPDWLETDRFDVTAKATAPFSTEEGRAMLRALIAERFGVVTHGETRELPVYIMRVVKSDRPRDRGLRPSTVACGAPSPAGGRVPCGLDVRFAAGSITASGVSMPQLARNLMGAVGRVIVDETGLAGVYDFDLRFTPEAGPSSPDSASLFTALQEQLGLRLEPGRAPIPVIVIDRAARPLAD